VAYAVEHPVSNAKIRVRYANPVKQSAVVRGAWSGALPVAPSFDGATVRITGAYGQGGTETISLPANAWTALGNGAGYKYVDRFGLAGGIKSVLVKVGRNGRPGTFKISTARNFVYGHRGLHTRVGASLEMGLDRWCADIQGPVDDGARILAAADTAPTSCPPDPVVDATWLEARLGDPDIQVVDTRATFGVGHIPGALPLRPEDLATIVDGIALQMMSPALAEPVLSGIGLRRDATVVVYGVAPEYDPARMVWALAYLGHPDVRYLDGGWTAWVAAGGAVAPGAPVAGAPTRYVADPIRPELRVTGDYVLAEIGPPPYDAPAIQLVDARTVGEYTSGHIPSAELHPWTANLSSGLLKPRVDLESLHDALGFGPAQTTVTYCLVGWRASVAWLTLRWLGYDDVRVYDGSWLEWGAGGFPVEP
jgi:thiosulfate/3-mercaptopyruvate sulfurtransferase